MIFVKIGLLLLMAALGILLFVSDEVQRSFFKCERDFGMMTLDVVSTKKDPVKAAEEYHEKLARTVDYICGMIITVMIIITVGVLMIAFNV